MERWAPARQRTAEEAQRCVRGTRKECGVALPLRHILPPSLRPQAARRALAAPIAPVVLRATFAEIAGVRLLADEVDEPGAAEVMRQLPRRGLVDPHQRRMQIEFAGHAERERGLHGADGVVAAIGIAGIVGLAHAADD